jgi:hypothetical protein
MDYRVSIGHAGTFNGCKAGFLWSHMQNSQPKINQMLYNEVIVGYIFLKIMAFTDLVINHENNMPVTPQNNGGFYCDDLMLININNCAIGASLDIVILSKRLIV